jgi:GntR family transcriptional regulator, transcriptional repressor for pyruvate dehydrogenase complex
MILKPIKKRKRLYQEVIERLQSLIENGEIKPGDKLPSERNLAELLSVSRSTIKEAFSVLESKGIINIHQGLGVFLAARPKNWLSKGIQNIIMDQQPYLSDLIELRQAIEGDAAYHAAKRMTVAQRKHLEQTFQELLYAEKREEPAVEEDYQFHLAIMEAANNKMMLEAMEVISQSIKSFLAINREESIKYSQMNEQVIEEHREIFEAIMEGRAEEARRAMWNHLRAVSVRHNH